MAIWVAKQLVSPICRAYHRYGKPVGKCAGLPGVGVWVWHLHPQRKVSQCHWKPIPQWQIRQVWWDFKFHLKWHQDVISTASCDLHTTWKQGWTYSKMHTEPVHKSKRNLNSRSQGLREQKTRLITSWDITQLHRGIYITNCGYIHHRDKHWSTRNQ